MSINCGCTRRDFVRLTLGTSVLGFSGLSFGQDTKARAKRMILLWMTGAPSQYETFDPKPGTGYGGPWKDTETSVKGVRISEHLPKVAKSMKDISLIRTLNSRDPNHETASYHLHTGYRKAPDTMHPHFMSVLLNEFGTRIDLPGCIAVGGNPPAGSGYLKPEIGPVVFDKLKEPTQDVMLAKGLSKSRLNDRWELLQDFERPFVKSHEDSTLDARTQAYKRAYKVLTSSKVKAFDVNEEKSSVRKRYGDTPFGHATLMARRLLEAGVPFVEVMFGDWDTHTDNFNGHKTLMDDLDPAYTALLKDLKDRRMLDDTLVVWMGEFGRTPRVNGSQGRDHFTKCWTAALSGGGIQGGRVVGETNKDGTDILKRPVSVQDLFSTIYSCFGVDTHKEFVNQARRPLPILDGGKVVTELF